jgi:hypothetical protein
VATADPPAESAASATPAEADLYEDAATTSQLTADLTRLASLHASGALTDAEFQAAKARLLGT